MNWRELVKYHIHVPFRTVYLLDTLHTIIPCPPVDSLSDFYCGKDVHLAQWARQGLQAGLITVTEHQRFMADVAPNL